MQPEELAKQFHETYERLVPEMGFQKSIATGMPWEMIPAKNKALVVAVAAEVLRWQEGQRTEVDFGEMVQKLTLHIALHQQLEKTLQSNETYIDLIDKQHKHIEALEQLAQRYAAQHALCNEEEPGQGCPCAECDRARELLKGGKASDE